VIGEEGVPGEEHLCHNAVAYDSRTGIVYVLWREYGDSFLQTYRLHPEEGTFERLQRQSVFKGVLEGLEANSLCLRPDSKEVAVWGTVGDDVVDCRTEHGLKMPERVRFGRLRVFSENGDRFVDVHSKINLHRIEGLNDPSTADSASKAADAGEATLLWTKCDFTFSLYYKYDQNGEATEIGIRYAADEYGAKPFYLNDHTVVINTPGGVLIGVDTTSGKADPLMEQYSQIEDLGVHHEKRLLLVGTKGKAGFPGVLNLLGLA
jgi:hypothetical protein